MKIPRQKIISNKLKPGRTRHSLSERFANPWSQEPSLFSVDYPYPRNPGHQWSEHIPSIILLPWFISRESFVSSIESLRRIMDWKIFWSAIVLSNRARRASSFCKSSSHSLTISSRLNVLVNKILCHFLWSYVIFIKPAIECLSSNQNFTKNQLKNSEILMDLTLKRLTDNQVTASVKNSKIQKFKRLRFPWSISFFNPEIGFCSRQKYIGGSKLAHSLIELKMDVYFPNLDFPGQRAV